MVPADMCRHEPVVPVRADPGRLMSEPAPAQIRACRCLTLSEPLKDRKKRCIWEQFEPLRPAHLSMWF